MEVTLNYLVAQRCTGLREVLDELLARHHGSTKKAALDMVFQKCGKCPNPTYCIEMACLCSQKVNDILLAANTPRTPRTAISIQSTIGHKVRSIAGKAFSFIASRPFTIRMKEAAFRRVIDRCGSCPDRFRCADLAIRHVEARKGNAGALALVLANCHRDWSWHIVIGGGKIQ